MSKTPSPVNAVSSRSGSSLWRALSFPVVWEKEICTLNLSSAAESNQLVSSLKLYRENRRCAALCEKSRKQISLRELCLPLLRLLTFESILIDSISPLAWSSLAHMNESSK